MAAERSDTDYSNIGHTMNQIINQFSQFQLTDSEQAAGQLMSSSQLAVIQNLRAEYSVKKINLTYTPDSHATFIQQEAEITGWINCLNYIMECHEVSAGELMRVNSSDNEVESGDATGAVFN